LVGLGWAVRGQRRRGYGGQRGVPGAAHGRGRGTWVRRWRRRFTRRGRQPASAGRPRFRGCADAGPWAGREAAWGRAGPPDSRRLLGPLGTAAGFTPPTAPLRPAP